MKETFAKIGTFLAAISGIAFIFYLYRIFKDVPLSDDTFPLSAEKIEAEKAVSAAKEELKEVDAKVFSDKEIEDRFNK